MLETLDYSIHNGSTPTFLYFDLYILYFIYIHVGSALPVLNFCVLKFIWNFQIFYFLDEPSKDSVLTPDDVKLLSEQVWSFYITK